MKIYTKTGDKGETSLVGGARVSKTHMRLEAYGTIDELNSQLGVCIATLALVAKSESGFEASQTLIGILQDQQHRLFNIGSLLACEDPKISANLPSLEDKDVKLLETYIDKATQKLAPLRDFILPGGTLASAHLHVARTIARRAERKIVRLGEAAVLQALIVPYINRLSDYLFVAAREANFILGHADIKWKKDP